MDVTDSLIYAAALDLVNEASAAHLTCGCAESCTGGLVSGAITAVPGSSAVLRGGVVSYAIAIKEEVLGVSKDVLDDPALGAVSEPCALQMCEGACRVLGCDVSVSVTGIAGPGGEEPGKPVGTVWFGLCAGGESRAERCVFSGDRDSVRRAAVLHALGLLREGVARLSR
jgi:nicotinamide-nucleotide amidase